MAFKKLKSLRVYMSFTTGEVPESNLLEYDFIYINVPDATIWAVEFVESRSSLMATKVSRPISDYLDDTQIAALDMADAPSGINPYTTESVRKSFLSYTAFISQVNDTATSGLLVVGHNYVIGTLVAGDDFANVGYVAEGTPFVATGTTPTTWTNSTSVLDMDDSAPTQVVLEKEFVAPAAWARTAVGTYTLTIADAFTTGKTIPIDDVYTDQDGNLYKLDWTSEDVMTLRTYAAVDTEVLADNVLNDRFINIEVYK